MSEQSSTRVKALQQFDSARRRAGREQLSARLTGRDTSLLSFEAVQNELRWQNPLYQGVLEIPVDAIVGSVGRYREFNRRFLPLTDSLRERWVQIEAMTAWAGWPPIETYKLGNIYFVRDGNHRVSVARQINIPTIEAHVWEYPGTLHIDPEADLDDIFIQLGQQTFMEKTGLDQLHPDHGIRFTTPGRYTELLVQIAELRQKLTQIDAEDMPYEEAVAAWYDMVYLPTIQVIAESTLLDDFPGRTEADLFVWLSKHVHQYALPAAEAPNLADTAGTLSARYREGGLNRLARQLRRILGSDELPPLVEETSTTTSENVA